MSTRRLALYRRAVEIMRWLRLVVATCVMGAAVFMLAGWLTASRQVASAERKLARERATLSELRESVASARRLAGSREYASASSEGALTSSVVADLNRSAQALGNLVLSVRPVATGEAVDQKAAEPVQLEMAMQGSFESIHGFLRRLDSQPLPLTIRSLDLRPQVDARDKARLDVQLKLAVISAEEE